MHSVQPRRRWGGGLRREQALLKIYSEQKLKWRCTEASGTEFASGEEAFTRSGWDGLYAATDFNACSGFFSSSNLPACFLKPCRPWASRMPWGRELHGLTAYCARTSPHRFKPTTHQLRWVIPVGKSSELCQALRCEPVKFGLRWSDVTDHLFMQYVVDTS